MAKNKQRKISLASLFRLEQALVDFHKPHRQIFRHRSGMGLEAMDRQRHEAGPFFDITWQFFGEVWKVINTHPVYKRREHARRFIVQRQVERVNKRMMERMKVQHA